MREDREDLARVRKTTGAALRFVRKGTEIALREQRRGVPWRNVGLSLRCVYVVAVR